MATRLSLAAYVFIVAVALAGVALAGLAVLTPYFYPSNHPTINFTTNITIPTFIPVNVTMPTGEEAAGAGSGFG